MAPSPTGFLHIGGVRTFLFNWLFARQLGGECLLRIENTDTSREVDESVEQIQESLRWLGIDWDGPGHLPARPDRRTARASASSSSPRARRTETTARSASACRTRARSRGTMPCAAGSSSRTRVLADPVIVRSDGRATYNFASPVDDMLDGITHVLRGDDHVSNTPTQINILRALGAELPVYAHIPNVFGERWQEALEAARRSRGRRVPRRRLPAGRR